MTGVWNQLSGTVYKTMHEELWMIGQVVLRGGRTVMPLCWLTRVTGVWSEPREKVWWPEMEKQVEEVLRACHPCQFVWPRAKPEPVRSIKLPKGPWKEISVDFLDISNGEHLLVVVGYYSRWTEAILLKKTGAHHVVKSMEVIFWGHMVYQKLWAVIMDLHLPCNSLRPS